MLRRICNPRLRRSTPSVPCSKSTTRACATLSHVSADGASPKMVDVGHKQVTRRSATARATVRLPAQVLRELKRLGGSQRRADDGRDAQLDDAHLLVGPKGPIGTTAIIAGVLAAKQTSALLPFCHPLPLDDVQVRITTPRADAIEIECCVRVTHRTGVEMEALTGASVAALCVYDMCKALSHDIVIERTRLVAKSGGKRDFVRHEEAEEAEKDGEDDAQA